jgi:hypothetical protein
MATPEKSRNQDLGWRHWKTEEGDERCEEGLSKKDNVWKRHSRKTLFDQDLDTSCENISADNFNTSSANDSLSVGGTAKMLTK